MGSKTDCDTGICDCEHRKEHCEVARRVATLARLYLLRPTHGAMKVLAFGDSLTAGYHSMGHGFAPWAPLLQRLIGVDTVDHIGLSGFTPQQMLDTKDDDAVKDVVPLTWPGYRSQLRRHGPYGVVLILGGTNDLADRIPTRDILSNVAALHQVAFEHGARTVAMTIPESKAATMVDWLCAARLEANQAIAAWAKTQPSSRTLLVDAANLVPYSESGPPFLWERDGLHMSAAGYEAFGRALAPPVADFIHESVECDGWHEGAAVRIVALERRAELNGKTARLLGRKACERAGAGRLAVLVDDGETKLSVGRKNLELISNTTP